RPPSAHTYTVPARERVLSPSGPPAHTPTLSLRGSACCPFARRCARATRGEDMPDWFVSTDPALVQLDTVFPWLHGCYWSRGVRRDVVERAFANSIVAGAYRGAAQIGVARAVTDQATFAWLADVFVDEAARGQGVATALVRALID